jgi:hypothetical protein
MRAKSFLKFLLVLTITAFVVVSCEDPYEPIDYSQLEKDELQLLKQYLDSNLNGLKDSALFKCGLTSIPEEVGLVTNVPEA